MNVTRNDLFFRIERGIEEPKRNPIIIHKKECVS